MAKAFSFNFTPEPEPKKIRLSIPSELADWYSKQAATHDGTLEAALVQALQFARRCAEEPETGKKRVQTKTPTQTSHLQEA